MFEIDIDIGGFVPLAAHESLEQQVHSGRVDCRDSQTVTDHRIGRRATALTEDAATTGKADQVPDGEKISLIAELFDQGELVPDSPLCFLRDPVGISPLRTRSVNAVR